MSRAREFADLAGSADAGGITGTNMVVNGAVNVNQRNADNTSSDTFGPDRYRLQFSGGGTTMSHEDMTSSDTPYSSGFRNFVRIKNTTTASGAGDYRQITYRLEAQDIANSGWDYTSTSAYMTVSFWVRSSVAGKFYFTLETGASGSDKYYGFSETLVADTWKKVEHSVPGNSTLTFANSNARGLGFIVRGWLGTNYTDSGFTEDTWGSFSLSSLTGDDLANWAGTTNSTLDVVGLQMEVGTNASDFEHRRFGEELSLCQRYFFMPSNDDRTMFALQGPVDAQVWWQFPFPTQMRSLPSFTVYGDNSKGQQGKALDGNNSDYETVDTTNYSTITVGKVLHTVGTQGANYSIKRAEFDAEL